MQNTYERILKYLIEHDVELTVKKCYPYYVEIKLRHANRYTSTRLMRDEWENEADKYFFAGVCDCLHRLFPSFKDFDTPIKGI